MIKYIIISLFCLGFAQAQDWNKYKVLKSSGSLPSDVITMSSDKYEQDKKTLENSTDKRKVKKAKDQFLLESNFHVDNMLRGGLVLFNDPLSVYISKVADELLKNDPTLRKQLNFHVLKSPVVNALATHEGYIFVTMGLLSQLNNEAELAFILSHEIVHFVKKHSIKSVENSVVKYSKSNMSDEEKQLSKCAYSRELESEADLSGLDYFTKSKYNKTAINTAFDVLAFSHIPFENKKFDLDFFQGEGFKMDSTWILTTPKEVSNKEEDDDSTSTHPNIQKRKAATQSKTSSESTEGKSFFIVGSEDEFIKIRKIARFELSHLFLTNGMYGSSIYHTWLLLQQEPNSQYLQGIMVRSLYALSRFAAANKMDVVLTDYNEVEGEEQQVFYNLTNMSDKYLTTLATKKALEYLTKFPNDNDVKIILNDLTYTLAFDLNLSISDFKMESNYVETIDTTKAGKLKKSKNKNNFECGLRDYLKSPLLLSSFEEAKKKIALEKDIKDKITHKKDKNNKEFFKMPENQVHVKYNHKYKLGIDKVSMIQPYYFKGDLRKSNKIKRQASEQILIDCMQELQEESAKAKVDLTINSPYLVKATEIEKFNLYQDQKSVFNTLIFNSRNDVKMEYFYTSEVDELRQKSGSDYLLMLGVTSFRVKKEGYAKLMLFMSFFFPYALPLTIYGVAKPSFETEIKSLLVDLKTKKPLMYTNFEIKNRDSSIMRRQYFYHILNQIKRKQK